jgi:GNAT superfamily N-acetyltransferase
MTAEDEETVRSELVRRLDRHLENYLGVWPPPAALVVIGSEKREEPGWDGRIRPITGVASTTGTVVSVPPRIAAAAQALAESGGFEALVVGLGRLLGQPDELLRGGTFRAQRFLADLEPLGEWVAPDDPRIPDWLAPFNGEVLAVFDEAGNYAGGVGQKFHDEFGTEFAVGTEPAYRGKGFARRLVATAARRVYEEGRVATYLHREDNFASAAVAEASGFPDEGWRALGLPAID